MTLVALGSAKGSPGVTTAVAALAARWPGDRRLLVVEADPAGGDLAPRLGLDVERGLVRLAAEGRRELTPEMLWQQTQPLPGSDAVQVLAGPASAEQSTAALSALSSRLANLLAGLDGIDVLADCGRLDPASPVMAMVRAAELMILVARPQVSQLHHLAARVQALGAGVATALLLVGDRPYGVVEAGRAVGAQPLGTIADDARAAELLSGGDHGRSRVLRASGLLRTARTLAEQLSARMGSGSADGRSSVATWPDPEPEQLRHPPPLAGREQAPSPPPPPPPPARPWSRQLEPDPEPPVPALAPSGAPAEPVAPWRSLADLATTVAPAPTPARSSEPPRPRQPPTERPRRTARARPLQARPHLSEADPPSSGPPPDPPDEENPDGPR